MHRERRKVTEARKIRKQQLQKRRENQKRKTKFTKYFRITVFIVIFALFYFFISAEYGWLGFISKLLLFLSILLITIAVLFILIRSKFKKQEEEKVSFRAMFIASLILVVMMSLSFIYVKNTIFDIPYLNHPCVVSLYDIKVSHEYARYGGSHYNLQGKDEDGNMHYFSLGKFEKHYITSRTNIKVTYLPNTNLVMKIE